MKQKILSAAAVLVLLPVIAVVALAMINRAADQPIVMPPETLSGKTPLFQKAAPIIQESCLVCHSSQAQIPWYGLLPIAKQLIQHNIEEGREEINLERALFTPGIAPSAKALRHIQEEVEKRKMPPVEYAALHWNAFLSAGEKQVLYDWIKEQQGSAENTNVPESDD